MKMLAPLALSLTMLIGLPASSDGQTRRPPAPPVATTLTADGGYRISTATARVHLVEYVSYTCGHCATFEAESRDPLLTTYLRSGATSIEVRPMVRDAIDLAAATLARCGASAQFFERHHALMGRQAEMMAAAERTSSSWEAVPIAQRLARIASDTGITAAVLPLGVTRAQANACLADRTAISRILAITEAGSALGVEGTPSFLINGQLQRGAHSWTALRTRLDAALTAR
jgi:protein-disulfide isomerase